MKSVHRDFVSSHVRVICFSCRDSDDVLALADRCFFPPPLSFVTGGHPPVRLIVADLHSSCLGLTGVEKKETDKKKKGSGYCATVPVVAVKGNPACVPSRWHGETEQQAAAGDAAGPPGEHRVLGPRAAGVVQGEETDCAYKRSPRNISYMSDLSTMGFFFCFCWHKVNHCKCICYIFLMCSSDL